VPGKVQPESEEVRKTAYTFSRMASGIFPGGPVILNPITSEPGEQVFAVHSGSQ